MTVGRLTGTPEGARLDLRRPSGAGGNSQAAVPQGLGPSLSMGMSDDFEVAIEEGATIVRVGRALFGERPHEHGPREPAHAH